MARGYTPKFEAYLASDGYKQAFEAMAAEIQKAHAVIAELMKHGRPK